jgi:hypothetical protein
VRKKACAGFLLGAEVVSCPLHSQPNIMDYEKFTLGTDKANENLRKQIFLVCKRLGVKDLTKALGRIEGLYNQIDDKDRVIREVCELHNVSNIGCVKNKVNGWKRKVGEVTSVPEKFNLDTSFLDGVGARWERNAEGKNQLEMVENLQKSITRQRNIVREYYHKFLEQVVICCENESLSETETREQVVRWHTAMTEDFDLLAATEFFSKYYGDQHNLSLLPKEPERILLVDALVIARQMTPKRLYRDLEDCGEQLGKISRYTYNKWEEKAVALTLFNGKQTEERKIEESKLKVEIIGLAVDRVLRGPESRPNIGLEEGTLAMLLYDPEVSPYLSTLEFPINDKTPLIEVLGHYQHNANLTPS